MIDYKKQGKRNLEKGRRFELLVRKDLESKGWIVSKWQNNVEIFEEDNQIPDDDGKCVWAKCIPAKQGRFRKTSTGFPDFIAYKMSCVPHKIYFAEYPCLPKEQIFPYVVIFVECKTNGYLKPEEKEKAKWCLENNYCSKFLVAKKGIKRGEIEYVEIN